MGKDLYPDFEEHLPVADRSASRIINRRAILDRIYQDRGISKARLAKELGISKPAVANSVADLIAMGLVEEKGKGESSSNGGPRPTMLNVNGQHRYIGVVDLSLQTPVCVVFDLESKITAMKNIIMSRADSQDDRRQRIMQTFMQMLDEAGVPREKLGIVVISQPGMMTDTMDTYYISSRHYQWTQLELRPFLQQRLGVPVLIKNDVNLAAMGEVHFGTETRLKDLLYISCGIGLGAGLVVNGELYEGSNNVAGEIGLMMLDDGTYLEDGIVADGLIDRAQRLYAENGKFETLTFPLIVERINSGDSLLEQAVYGIGRELGRVIQNCSVFIDISTIIFGGEYLSLGPELFRGMREFIGKSRASNFTLVPSTLGNTASLYGGSVIGRETIFTTLTGER